MKFAAAFTPVVTVSTLDSLVTPPEDAATVYLPAAPLSAAKVSAPEPYGATTGAPTGNAKPMTSPARACLL